MTDTFGGMTESLRSLSLDLVAVTQDDATDLSYVPRAINVAVGGAIRVTTLQEQPVRLPLQRGSCCRFVCNAYRRPEQPLPAFCFVLMSNLQTGCVLGRVGTFGIDLDIRPLSTSEILSLQPLLMASLYEGQTIQDADAVIATLNIAGLAPLTDMSVQVTADDEANPPNFAESAPFALPDTAVVLETSDTQGRFRPVYQVPRIPMPGANVSGKPKRHHAVNP